MTIPSIRTLRGLAIICITAGYIYPLCVSDQINHGSFIITSAVYLIFSWTIPFLFTSFGYLFAINIEQGDTKKYFIDIFLQIIAILVFWILINGIFWGNNWLGDIVNAKSMKPLIWNIVALPRFAFKLHPELFFFRGTSEYLWFLFSLAAGVAGVFLQIVIGLKKIFIVVLMIMVYCFILITCQYSQMVLKTGFYLPLEQQGPLVAYFFLSLGFLLQDHEIKINSLYIMVIGVLLMIFELIVSYKLHIVFSGNYQYSLSTPIFVAGLMSFALQYNDFGKGSMLERIGSNYLGIYLVGPPVLGALNYFRTYFRSIPLCFLFFLILFGLSYLIMLGVRNIPLINRFFIINA